MRMKYQFIRPLFKILIGVTNNYYKYDIIDTYFKLIINYDYILKNYCIR